MFIKDYRAKIGGVLIIIMLLAGYVPHLQVAWIDRVIGRFAISWFLRWKIGPN